MICVCCGSAAMAERREVTAQVTGGSAAVTAADSLTSAAAAGSVRARGGNSGAYEGVAGWSPDLLAKVELRDFNLTGEPDDRRDTTAGRAAGESRRQRLSEEHCRFALVAALEEGLEQRVMLFGREWKNLGLTFPLLG